MPKSPATALASLVCAVTVLCTAAGAQQLGGRATGAIEGAPVDIAQLTARADLVAHGAITRKTARWIDRVIYTQYDIVVQETLKGAPRGSVTLAVAGGALGNVRLAVPGAPDLQVGQQLVLFGVPMQGQPVFTPVGTFEGVVEIRAGRGAVAQTVAPRGVPETLEAFLQEIRTLSRRP